MECDTGTSGRIKGGNELVGKNRHRRKAHTCRINIANYAGLIDAENTHTQPCIHTLTMFCCLCVISSVCAGCVCFKFWFFFL